METLLFLLFVVGMFLLARNFDKVLDWVGSYFIEGSVPVPDAPAPEPLLTWTITKCSQACVEANRSGVCECDALQFGTAVLKGYVPSDWSGRRLEVTDLVDRNAEFALRDTVFVMWFAHTKGPDFPITQFVASTYLPGQDESIEDIARILKESGAAQPITFSYEGGEIVPSHPLAWTMLVAYSQPDAG